MIAFQVTGTPKPQPRPKAYRRGKRAGVYDPGTANEWKWKVGIEAEKHAPPEPLEGPLDVVLEFRMPRPKSHYGTGRNAGTLKASAPARWHVGRLDLDNLAKAVLDALTEAGMWRDDGQIVLLSLLKEYDSVPGVFVSVEEA